MDSIRNRPGLQGILILSLLASIYILINLALPRLPVNSLVSVFVIQPVLWGLLALMIWKLCPCLPAVKIRHRATFIQIAALIGFVQIVTLTIGGLFSGFGKNPTAFTPLGIAGNLAYVSGTLVGMEFSRAWLVNRLGKRHTFLAVFLVAFLFTFLSQSWAKIGGFSWSIDSIPDNSAVWLPALGESLLATTLALMAGPRASLAYRGILAAFWWFCPVLPDLQWTLKTLIGTLVPILGMLAVNNFYISQGVSGKPRRRAKKESFPAATVIAAVFVMLLAWFGSGALPFQPLVVPTGSMIPVFYPGDIVIIAKTQAKNVNVGDIVEYRSADNNINIIHRVINIQENGSQKTYIFKGDNNDAPDNVPVTEQQILGKEIFRVPKVGWVSLYIKTLLSGG
jgi:signal peptidase I